MAKVIPGWRMEDPETVIAKSKEIVRTGEELSKVYRDFIADIKVLADVGSNVVAIVPVLEDLQTDVAAMHDGFVETLSIMLGKMQKDQETEAEKIIID